MAELKIVDNATCTFCGCVCDDMELTVEDNRITKAKNACVLGKAWFLNHHIEERPVALIEGQPATLEAAVDRAACILAGARYPIVYGLSDTTCEAQRVAVAIADRVGGCVDTTTSVCHRPSGMAFQGVGEVTCSLGEVKNRADLVNFWGCNPAAARPRQGDGGGQRRELPDGLPVRGEPGPRLPALQPGRVHDVRHAGPRRGGRGPDRGVGPDGELLASRARAPVPHPVRRPGPQ